MEAIELYYRGEKIREFQLGDRPLELGRAAYCDIVVHDSAVADRQLLLSSERGTVLAYDLRGEPHRRAPTVLPRERPVPVGEHHAIVRVDAAIPSEPETLRIDRPPVASRRFELVVGRGADARRTRLGSIPTTVGSGADNEVVLRDPAVSGRHLRLEVCPGGVRVRDLGSRNGTFVEGTRVFAIELRNAASIRVGRSELFLVPLDDGPEPTDVVRASAVMHEVLAAVDRAAALPFPVLVLGETGVGKEAIARRVHAASRRCHGPFVSINASAFNLELAGSELFGHEKGAYTGAGAQHRGVFEQASGGTLFLDELGELPLELQARLLRVLEQGVIRRVGGSVDVPVDVRVVAATHRPLAAMVEAGRFRADLYFRLAQLPIAVPPLRERPEDIVPIAVHLLALLAPSLGERELSPEAEGLLLGHAFPGNVRELRNVLLSAAASTSSPVLEADAIVAAIARVSLAPRVAPGLSAVTATIDHFKGNVAQAARALGIPRTTLRDRARRELANGAGSAQRTTNDA